jgi:hypothetical protein
MSPSTKNLRARKGFFSITLLSLIVVVEVSFRLIGPQLSGNIRQIDEFPSLFKQLDEVNGKKAVFVGNSLSDKAIDNRYLNQELNINSIKITPDSTSLWDWQCIIRNNILNSLDIDTLVIGFAWNQLEDEYPVDASRIGAYFCSWSDIWNSRADNGLSTFDLNAEFIASKVSHFYANREIVRSRLLSLFVPHYQTQTQRLNRGIAPQVEHQTSVEKQYNVLTGLIADLEKAEIEVVVIAMPVLNPYLLDQQLIDTVQQAGGSFFDYRALSSIDAALFLDDMHLDEDGQAIFTRELSRDLQRLKIGD